LSAYTLALHVDRPGPEPVRLDAGVRVVYVAEGRASIDGAELAENEAWHGAGRLVVEAPGSVLLRWELSAGEAAAGAALAATIELDAGQEYLVRCDRVDFPPAGEALLHTHQGPGIRCLLFGSFEVETDGERIGLEPYGSWFEAGPSPVYARAGDESAAAFARVMVLPRRLLGQSSIRYVRDEDRDRPKSQRYTVFVDAPLELPA
jgi:hypothetical protein